MFVFHVLHFNSSLRFQTKKKMKKVTMKTVIPYQNLDQLSTTFLICPCGIWPRKRKMSCANREMKRWVTDTIGWPMLILFWWGEINCVLFKNTICTYLLSQFFGNLMKEQELNTLKKKSPSDLWKEDLAVFIEELEVCVYKGYINT